MTKTRYLSIIFLFFAAHVLAQTGTNSSPTPVEILAGNNRLYLTTVINRPLGNNFEFFSLMMGTVDYENTFSENEMVISNAIRYVIVPNFRIAGNLKLHFKKGIMPGLGFEYLTRSSNWVFNIKSGYLCLPSNFIDNVVITEFKPKLNDKLRLYTKLQYKLNWDITDNSHDRSFFIARLGLTKNKYTYGIGTNLDWYGPSEFQRKNTGIFLKMIL